MLFGAKGDPMHPDRVTNKAVAQKTRCKMRSTSEYKLLYSLA